MRVLIVVHGLPPGAQGGTELYADAHARELAQRHDDDVLVLARESNPALAEYAKRDERREYTARFVNHTFRDIRDFGGTYVNESIDAIAAQAIDEFRPNVAHVHHLTCLSTNIVRLLADRGVPCVLTLNDYWLICHRGQLFDTSLRPCAGLDAGCRQCLGLPATGPAPYAAASLVRSVHRLLPAAPARTLRRGMDWLTRRTSGPDDEGEVLKRVAHMRHTCTLVDRFIAPSRYMRDRFVAFGVPDDRIVISEYGIDTGPYEASARRATGDASSRSNGQLRLGYVGSMMVSKAPHLVVEAHALLPSGRSTVDLFGGALAYHGDSSYARVMEPLLALPGVRAHGPWPHDRLAEALAQLDVLVVPSVWAENSPFVIREALAAGVPVVASRIGGIPESVTDGVNGLLFTPGSVDDLHRALRRLLDEPGLLERLRKDRPRVRTITEAIAELRGIYLELQATAARA